ncbi:MAG: LysM peptidoglycan-binding domain-containing protein [Bacteroidetes bacterium]|nr:MAG: LysM peptidoglycan-binding domain-containing protein [Bacteroidota bacterium]
MRFFKYTAYLVLWCLVPAAATAQTDYANRLATIPDVNIKYNAVVDGYINELLRTPNSAAQALGRYIYFKPVIDSMLTQYGVPSSVGLMVLGNSMADCTYSDAEGYAGPWAMSYNVGRLWDLKMNTYVDERRDLAKSSFAAAKCMKELRFLYNSPDLALAAFATNTTTINKYIRLTGNKFNYWDMYDSLPKAAQKIVPAYLAAVYLYHFHAEHGISPIAYNPPAYDTVSVNKWQSFDEMATVLNASSKELKELNPEFKQGIVPTSRIPYVIKLPSKSKQHFNKLDALDFKPYNTNPYIEKVPELENRNLPIRKGSDTAQSDVAATPKKANTPTSTVKNTEDGGKEKSDTTTHIVAKGEGLGTIAQKHGVKVDDIKKWNNLKGYNIYPNQKLVIYNSKAK